jgi:hypothetical protein
MDISENDLTNKNNGADGVIACLFLFFFWFRGNILGYIYIHIHMYIYIYAHHSQDEDWYLPGSPWDIVRL